MNSPAMLSTSAYGINPDHRIVDSSRVWWHISYLLDVLTPLSDCRKNPSKRWNGEFRGFRICVGWISTTGFCVVGFYVPDYYQSILCLFCVSLLSLFLSLFRLPRRWLPRPIYTTQAITHLPPLHGYHACVYIYISRLPRHSS